MKYLSILVLSFTLFLSSFSFASDKCYPYSEDYYKKVVLVVTDKGTGSGVVVGKDQVLTAKHVVEGAAKVRIAVKQDQLTTGVIVLREAEIQRHSKEHDLSLLKVSTEGLLISEVAGQEQLDLVVWTVSHPRGGLLRTSLGIILAQNEDRVVSDTFVRRGSSGGALMACTKDGDPKLFGIISTLSQKMYPGSAVPSNEGIATSVSNKAISKFLSTP